MKVSLIALSIIIPTVNARFIASDDPSDASSSPFNGDSVLPPGFDKTRMMIKYANDAGRKSASSAATKVHMELSSQNVVVASVRVLTN